MKGQISEERKDFLAGIITTAIEGGINYWSKVHKYEWGDKVGNYQFPINYAYAKIQDFGDDEPGKVYEITMSKVSKALKLFRDGKIDLRSDILQEILLSDTTNGEEGTIDVECADCIIQVICFNDVIYG